MHFPLFRPLLDLGEYIALYFGLAFLGILFLIWNPVAIILRPLLPHAWARIVGRCAITTGFRIYLGGLALTRACRLDLSALDTLRGEPPLIIAPNHPSLIDAALVLSRLPATCIMKAELMGNFLLSPGARLAGYICNDTVHGMIVNSTASLRQGAHLLVFPEGTRTTRSPVNPFFRSVGVIARHAGVAVQTVFIDTDSPYLRKGWPLFRRPTFPITYRIRLGKRFDPPEETRQFVHELEQYFAQELAEGSMMQAWLPAAAVPHEPPQA